MIPWPDHSRVGFTLGPVAAHLLDQLDQLEERAHVAETSARPDTVTILVTDGAEGAILAYAVFGQDGADMICIYAARCLVPIVGPMALRSLLGVAQVMGKPLRVHSGRVAKLARAIGAGEAWEAIDSEGLPMGVFHGQ